MASLVAVMALGLAATVNVNAAPFPALNTPATTERVPGKLIWADLFTSEPVAASKFYCDLLGWTATTIDQKGKSYTIFMNDGVPVAGLAPHAMAKESHPSRWIGYVSVSDIKATIATVEKNGGAVHAAANTRRSSATTRATRSACSSRARATRPMPTQRLALGTGSRST
jgi:hypothetical protein